MLTDYRSFYKPKAGSQVPTPSYMSWYKNSKPKERINYASFYKRNRSQAESR